MTHTYNITGMTCTGCQTKVQFLLAKVPGVTGVTIDLAQVKADITMEKHISTPELQKALKEYPKYQLSEHFQLPAENDITSRPDTPWWQTYKPILLIFGYVSLISVIAAGGEHHFDVTKAMRTFMSGFFLSFSFFKMLDLPGFANSYSTYDIVAKRFRGWGYVYAFTELALGIAYVVNFNPLLTNLVTFVIMTISITGVLQSVLNKRKIKCACLGAVFNLPMSTVTIIEDALMIIMSGVMIAELL